HPVAPAPAPRPSPSRPLPECSVRTSARPCPATGRWPPRHGQVRPFPAAPAPRQGRAGRGRSGVETRRSRRNTPVRPEADRSTPPPHHLAGGVVRPVRRRPGPVVEEAPSGACDLEPPTSPAVGGLPPGAPV